MRDLVRHMGGVHRWATGYVAEARTEVLDVGLDEVVGAWPADTELAGWLRQGCADARWRAGRRAGRPQCWTFLPAPSPLAMWARRQAHETAIHRVDAELAAGGAVDPFAAPFAADGVDELLACFVPRRSTTLRAEPPAALAVRCTDATPPGCCASGPTASRRTLRPAAGDAGDCTVRGTAADLYLALWNRAGAEASTIEGDRAVLGLFRESVRVRWA